MTALPDGTIVITAHGQLDQGFYDMILGSWAGGMGTIGGGAIGLIAAEGLAGTELGATLGVGGGPAGSAIGCLVGGGIGLMVGTASYAFASRQGPSGLRTVQN